MCTDAALCRGIPSQPGTIALLIDQAEHTICQTMNFQWGCTGESAVFHQPTWCHSVATLPLYSLLFSCSALTLKCHCWTGGFIIIPSFPIIKFQEIKSNKTVLHLGVKEGNIKLVEYLLGIRLPNMKDFVNMKVSPILTWKSELCSQNDSVPEFTVCCTFKLQWVSSSSHDV